MQPSSAPRDATAPPRLTPFAVSYAGIVLIFIALVYSTVAIQSAVRGYVGAEGLWSKAQKQAVACLQRYAVTRDDADIACYRQHIAVPLAGRRAREELQQDRADMAVVRQAFLDGRIHPDDIAGMTRLFRWFGNYAPMRKAIEIWAEADAEIERLEQLARDVQSHVADGRSHDNAAVAATLQSVRALDARLTTLKDDFSATLGAGARQIRRTIYTAAVIIGAQLLLLALIFARRWIATWQQAQQLAQDRAARMQAVATAAAGVVSAASREELSSVLRDASAEVIDYDAFTFGVYYAEQHAFHFLGGYADGAYHRPQVVAAAGTPSERFLYERGSLLTLRCTDPRALGAVPTSTRRSESIIRSPIYSGQRLLGVVSVQSYTPDHYDQADVEVMEVLASMAAISLQRIETAEERRHALDSLHAREEQLRQAQKMEAVGLLAGGVAHDFNNLLTAIRGHAELLSDAGLDGVQRDYAVEISRAADRAAALTGQLLAFSRKQVLQPRVIDVNALVTNVKSLVSRLIGEDVQLLTSLDADIGHVRADPHQLEQVILNLALNGRDAMPQGGTLIIETCNVDMRRVPPDSPTLVPGSYVRLSVQDAGEGISEETRERIFEPFYTTKALGKGTGLGLSTVYGIVKQSGGYIFARSTMGAGTTMEVYLPRTNEPLDPPEAEPPSSIPPQQSATILVVEDEDAVRALVARVLQRSGYQVLQAGNGDEALRVLGNGNRVDLLLTDLVMPGMSGVALTQQALAALPGLRVMYMSGYTEDEVFRRGLERGGEAFLQKPFTSAALLGAVADTLHRT